jgi:HNH endonuclease
MEMGGNTSDADVAPIPGHPNYTISRDGKTIMNVVRNFKVAQFTCNGGYLGAGVGGNVEQVHRLVLFAFEGPPEHDQLTCDHIDQDKQNNHFDNLRWATRKEQAANHKHIKERPNKRRAVVVTSANGKVVNYESSKEAAAAIKPSTCQHRSAISRVSTALAQGKKLWGYTISRSPVDNEQNCQDVPESFVRGTKGVRACPTGRIKRPDGHLTTGWKDKQGYMKMALGRKSYPVHRLIAAAFLDLKDEDSVTHLNDDKTDNRVENLKIITIKRTKDLRTHPVVREVLKSKLEQPKADDKIMAKINKLLVSDTTMSADKKRKWLDFMQDL